MGVKDNLNIKITGQVNGEDNTKNIVIAKLQVICAEYELELDEE